MLRNLMIYCSCILTISSAVGTEPHNEESYTKKSGMKNIRRQDYMPELNAEILFSDPDRFYLIAQNLNFKDRLIGLGTVCKSFRNMTIDAVTHFSDQFEYDLVDIDQFFPKPSNSLLTFIDRDHQYVHVPSQYRKDFQIFNSLQYKRKIPENYLLEPISLITDDASWITRKCYQIVKKTDENAVKLPTKTYKDLTYIPQEYHSIGNHHDSYLNSFRNAFVGQGSFHYQFYNLFGKVIHIFSSNTECSAIKHTGIPQYDDNDCLKIFTNLTDLNLSSNKTVRNDSITSLKNLRSLNLASNQMITDDTLKSLTSLVSLQLSYNFGYGLGIQSNTKITDDSLKYLTNLQTLDIFNNKIITNKSLSHLTNLTSLNMSSGLANAAFKALANLKKLELFIDESFDFEELFHLTTLTKLEIIEDDELYQPEFSGGQSYHNLYFELWNKLPNLELYRYQVPEGDGYYDERPYVTNDGFETREQFNAKQVLIKQFIEKLKTDHPEYTSQKITKKLRKFVWSLPAHQRK